MSQTTILLNLINNISNCTINVISNGTQIIYVFRPDLYPLGRDVQVVFNDEKQEAYFLYFYLNDDDYSEEVVPYSKFTVAYFNKVLQLI